MKFEHVYGAMMNGSKIRVKHWIQGKYWFFDKSDCEIKTQKVRVPQIPLDILEEDRMKWIDANPIHLIDEIDVVRNVDHVVFNTMSENWEIVDIEKEQMFFEDAIKFARNYHYDIRIDNHLFCMNDVGALFEVVGNVVSNLETISICNNLLVRKDWYIFK